MNDIEFEELLRNPDKQKLYTHSQLAMFGVRYRPLLNTVEIALLLNMSEGEIGSAKTEMKLNSLEVVEAIEAGQITISNAYGIRKLPQEQRAKALADTIATRQQVLRRVIPQPSSHKGEVNNSPRRPIEGKVTRSLDQLENAVEMLEQFTDGGGKDHPDFLQWLRRAYKIRRKLSEFINNHMEERNGKQR